MHYKASDTEEKTFSATKVFIIIVVSIIVIILTFVVLNFYGERRLQEQLLTNWCVYKITDKSYEPYILDITENELTVCLGDKTISTYRYGIVSYNKILINGITYKINILSTKSSITGSKETGIEISPPIINQGNDFEIWVEEKG